MDKSYYGHFYNMPIYTFHLFNYRLTIGLRALHSDNDKFRFEFVFGWRTFPISGFWFNSERLRS